MSLVVGEFDVVGDDDEGYAVIGATPARNAHASRLARHAPVRVPTPRWMNAATSQGVSRPQEELDVLPFEPLTIAENGTQGVLIARPQRPFRGERLIVGAAEITSGDDVAHLATINPAIYVGAVQVGAAQGAIPFRAFGPDAFGVRLSWPAAGQGTDIKIYVVLTTAAPAGGVICTATIIGRAMR